MRALFLLITVLCASAYSINPFTYPWIIRLTGDTATVAKWKGNNDTVQVWAGRMSDTANKISREIDSIRAGKVAHDSMTVTGNLRAATYNDSITAAEFAHINGLTGNVQAAINRRLYGTITAGWLALKSGDTLKTSIISDNGTTATVNGVFKVQGSSFAIATSATGNTLEFLRDGVNYITALAGTASIMIIEGYSYVGLRVNGVDKLNVSSKVTKVYDNSINRSGTTSRGLSFEADDDGVFSDTVKARVGTFSGVVTADSLRTPKGISGVNARFTSFIGNVTGSISGGTVAGSTGTFSGLVTADSLRTPKGISGVNARFTSFIGSLIGNVTGNVTGSISGGTVAGSTGTFSGNVIVDSLKSTKGISGVNARFTSFIGSLIGNVTGSISGGTVAGSTGTFSGNVIVDSLKSTKGISGTIGRFSSLIFGDSLAITKGITATYGRFSSAVFGTSATFTGTVTVDSLKSTKGVNATTGTFSGVVRADSLRSTKGVSGTIGRFTTSVLSAIGTFTGRVTALSFSTNGEDTLVYNDTTFYDSLFDGTTYRARVLARIIQIGNEVTLYQPPLTGTVTATTLTSLKGIPVAFRPSAPQSYMSFVMHTAKTPGEYRVQTDGSIYVLNGSDGTYLNAGTVYISVQSLIPSPNSASIQIRWVL